MSTTDTALNRRSFIAAAAAAAGGAACPAIAATPTMKHGWNVNSSSYYDGASLFINRLLDAAVSGEITPNGYPPGGAGKSTNYLVIAENAHEWWSYKPGTYKVKGTGTGATVQVDGVGFKGVTQQTAKGEPFSLAVVLPPLGLPVGEAAMTFVGEHYLRVVVNGGTSALADLAVVHADDEADFAAGKVYTAEARTGLVTASRGPLRPMALMQTVSGWIKDPSDLPSDDNIGLTGYFIEYPGKGHGKDRYRLPSPEKLAKLANESGSPLWVSLWVMASDATLKAFFDRLAAAYPSGDLYVEGGNEVWNNAYTANSGFLATEYGRPEYQGTGLTNGSSEAIMHNAAHFSLRCFRAAEAASAFNGRARVKRVFNCQLGWPDRSFIGLDYVDPGIVSKGQKFGKLIDSPCVATYFLLAHDKLTTGGNTGRGITQIPKYGIGLSRKRLIKDRIYENGDGNAQNAAVWLEKAWKNSIDDVKEFIRAYQIRLASSGYAALRYSYEGAWSHDDVPAFELGTENDDPKKIAGLPGVCMAYNASSGALTPANAVVGGVAFNNATESLASWFTDGDLVRIGYSGASGLAEYRTFACRRVADTLYLYATASAFAARKARSGGANGQVLVVNASRMTAHNRVLLNQLWTNKSVDGTGVSVLEYYHARMIEAGLTLDCTFTLVGAATTAFRDFTGTKPWAFKPHGYHAPDTPAVTWVRQKT